MKKENDILEVTLSIASHDYTEAYNYLLKEYEKNPKVFGHQTLYFLSCLASGADLTLKALEWLKIAIIDNCWWYRPEVLEDDDLASISDNEEFITIKSISDKRYFEALKSTKSIFSWERKNSNNLFLAVHGNTQNAQTARNDWKNLLDINWQLETIQSAEPDSFGTYRWSYNNESYIPIANALKKIKNEGYNKIVCGGFSAGCDMLLRVILYENISFDTLILQSPWIPILEDNKNELVNTIKQKNIKLIICCGALDEDCFPMAKELYELTKNENIEVKLFIQEGNHHQFPVNNFSLINYI